MLKSLKRTKNELFPYLMKYFKSSTCFFKLQIICYLYYKSFCGLPIKIRHMYFAAHLILGVTMHFTLDNEIWVEVTCVVLHRVMHFTFAMVTSIFPVSSCSSSMDSGVRPTIMQQPTTHGHAAWVKNESRLFKAIKILGVACYCNIT